MNIPIYNQYDVRWRDVIMEPSGLNLRRWGCFTTAIAMALHNYAIKIDPGEFCKLLVKNNGYTDDGMIKYDGIERAIHQVSFYERGYTSNIKDNRTSKTEISTAIKKIQKLVRFGMPTLLAVDNVYADDIPDHAVLLVDAPDNLDDWVIHDPDGGNRILFKDKYGNPMDKIFGWVALIGTPVEVPEGGDSTLAQVTSKLSQAKKGINPELMVREALDMLLGA